MENNFGENIPEVLTTRCMLKQIEVSRKRLPEFMARICIRLTKAQCSYLGNFFNISTSSNADGQ